jgi:hypothetical protein
MQVTDMASLVLKVGCFAIPMYTWGATVLGATMMSNVWYLGRAYLRVFENCTRASTGLDTKSKQLILKSVKALRPIRINIGGLYYMEKDAKLTVMNFIVVGTVNMLLLLQNK